MSAGDFLCNTISNIC